MTPPKARQPADTREQILDLAEMLMQTRGYNAFSYQDISSQLGITKASIHYHFPSKAGLGTAVIDRYSQGAGEGLSAIAADQSQTSMAMLDRYFEPYLQFARSRERVCLCGSLAGEMMALPPEMRERVDRFFREHHAWLAAILKRGAERGEFKLSAPVAKTARMVFGALQGGLLVQRTTGDAAQLKDVMAALKAQLLAGSHASA